MRGGIGIICWMRCPLLRCKISRREGKGRLHCAVDLGGVRVGHLDGVIAAECMREICLMS